MYSQQIFKDFIANSKSTSPQNINSKHIKLPSSNVNIQNLKDEFVNIKNNNGLFEKLYDYLKNLTNLGIGSKNFNKKFEQAENNTLKKEDLKKEIEKYKNSQINARETFGDGISTLVAASSYFGSKNILNKLITRDKLTKNTPKSFDELLKDAPKRLTKAINFVRNTSGLKRTILLLPFVALIGGYTKYLVMKINRIGSKEYSIENKNNLNKDEYKLKKKELNAKKRKNSFKNFITGSINGLLSPITAIYGGIIGVPAYLLANTGLRYVFNNKNNKSSSDFWEKLKDNYLFNIMIAAAVSIPLFRKANYSSILNKNLANAYEALKGIEFEELDVVAESAYEQLKRILLDSPKISSICSDLISDEEKIVRISKENIFAIKFLQVSDTELGKILKENCPPTRTITEANQLINELLNSQDYQLTKCLGVGTIAETYLAKDKSGKEVCIKILKNGITKEKILEDKEKFIKLITNGIPEGELDNEQKYLKKNIENLADSILNEVNFENEAKAAVELAKVTRQANLVKPIRVKNNVYIMEKAPGISLSTLNSYVLKKCSLKKLYERNLPKNPAYSQIIESLKQEIENLKKKSPDFEDFDFSQEDLKKLFYSYIDIITEQFVKIDRNGKIIHGDIHPGNIFIDLNVLKGKDKRKKLFTLIDTGNTINLNRDQAIRARRLTTYIQKSNYKDIAKMITEDALLPPNLTLAEARKLVEKDLKEIFFNPRYVLGKLTNEKIFDLTDCILRKYDIIPNNTHLTYIKSKSSATDSLQTLFHTLTLDKFGLNTKTRLDKVKKAGDMTIELTRIIAKYISSTKIQEIKNLLKMTPKEILEYIRNTNMTKANSYEQQIYDLKQCMS